VSREPRLSWRVWLTGASSGIGEALARELARRGAHLALFARRREELEALREELLASVPRPAGEPPPEFLVQPGDVRDRERVHAAVKEAEERFGALDVGILNAGTGDSLFPERFDAALVERIFAVNVLGAVYGIEALLPGMLARRRGKIAGISSIAAVRGLPISAPYCASKAALTTFLESLRLDLRPHGVEVITVSPGFVKTPLTDRNRHPMPFLQPAEKAARRIVRGIERGKRHIHFPRALTVPVMLLRLLPVPLYDALMSLLLRGRGYHKVKAER
jgi:NAD(P)-dependent dehydrogenase (short-subunit alcohol dehydrogenase family)